MSQDIILDTQLQQTKNLAWWLYLIHGASFVFSLGAFSFIPLIINYVKRDEAAGTFVLQPSQLDDPFLLVVCGLDRRRRHPVDHADRHSTGVSRVGRGLAVESLPPAARLPRPEQQQARTHVATCGQAGVLAHCRYIAANARSISAIKSCGASSPTFRRTNWPGNCQPLRMAAMRYGITRLFAPPQL